MEDKETVDIQIKFQTSGLLGYFKSLNMWVVCFGTKYKTKNKAILAYNANPVILILKFWKRETICQVFGFIKLK